MLLLSICSFITFTSCQDDVIDNGKSSPAPEGAQKTLLEAYGLTFENFVTANDVQILNNDTTEISVNKALAEKLGITSFVNHPMGIWDAKNHLPYARKATAEKLLGDRYILTVQPATIAEILGDKKVTLNTSIYVNQNVTGDQTRAGLDMPSYAAKFMDEDNVIHPAVILCTDPYGYDNTYHDSDAQPKAGTRATGEFQYYDTEALAKEGSRASVRRNILSIHENLKCHKELKSGGSTATFDFKAPTDFELNYFLTLDGGVKWKVIVPCPYVKTFETGLDGVDAKFKASVEMAAKAEAGVKLKVLGYEIAEWSKDFDIVGPWTLFKYPSDGSEHKTPAMQQQDQLRKLLEKGSREYKEAMSELVDIKAQMGGKSYKDAENELLSELNKLTESISNDNDKLVKAYDYILMGRNSIQKEYEQWRIEQIIGYRDVAFYEALDQTMKFPEVEKAKRLDPNNFQRAVDNIHEIAIKKYGDKSSADSRYVELVRRYIVVHFQQTCGSRYTNFK